VVPGSVLQGDREDVRLESQAALVWGLIASLIIANLILLLLNLPLVGIWVKLLEIPKPYLFAGIMTFALLGTYAVNGSTFDVVVLLVLGVIGYLMRRFGFPITPMIVGAILGPLAEVQLRRALDIAGGDVSTLVSTPFTIVVYATLLAALVGGYLLRRRADREVHAPASEEDMVDEAATRRP
jgi:putative tricarboxylic transport membrane protein